MIIKKTYKFRLNCTSEIKEKLEDFAKCNRFVWNYFVKLNSWRLANGYRIMRYYEMAYWCTLIKSTDEYAFLNECPAAVLQQKLRNLEQAYKMAFDKTQAARIPVIHHDDRYSGLRFPQAEHCSIQKKGKGKHKKHFKIRIPNIGFIPFVKSREIEGTPKNVTIYSQGGHWYVSIQVDLDISPKKIQLPENSIAIYMGDANNFAVCFSDKHQKLVPSLEFTWILNRLIRLQKGLARKIKFKVNWKKRCRRMERLHDRITREKTDFLHKLSTTICTEYDYIFIEDLDLKQMIKIPKSDKKNKTRKQQIAEKNKYITTQAWGIFTRFLTYKSEWSGSKLVIINQPLITITQKNINECIDSARNIMITGRELIGQKK